MPAITVWEEIDNTAACSRLGKIPRHSYVCGTGLCACMYVCIHSQIFIGLLLYALCCCGSWRYRAEKNKMSDVKLLLQLYIYIYSAVVRRLRQQLLPGVLDCDANTYIYVCVYVCVLYIYEVLPYLRIFYPTSIFLRQDVVDRMRLAPMGLGV